MSGLHQSVTDGAKDVRLCRCRNYDSDQVAAAGQANSLCRARCGHGARFAALKSKVAMFACLAVCFVQDAADAAHVALAVIFRQNGEKRAQAAFVFRRGLAISPRLCGSWASRSRSHAGQRVNVDLAAVMRLPPREHRSCPARDGRQPHPRQMLWPLAQQHTGLGSDPGLRRGLLRRCASSPHKACSWAMKKADRPSGGQASDLGRSRCNTFPLQHIRCGGTGVRGRSQLHRPCGLRRRAWMTW